MRRFPKKNQPKTSLFEQSFSPIDITNSPFLTPDEIALWGPITSILSFLPCPPPNITKKRQQLQFKRRNPETNSKKNVEKRAPSNAPFLRSSSPPFGTSKSSLRMARETLWTAGIAGAFRRSWSMDKLWVIMVIIGIFPGPPWARMIMVIHECAWEIISLGNN